MIAFPLPRLARAAAALLPLAVLASACAATTIDESTAESGGAAKSAFGVWCGADGDCAPGLVCRPQNPGGPVLQSLCLDPAPGANVVPGTSPPARGALETLGCFDTKDCKGGFACEDAKGYLHTAGTCRETRCAKDADCGKGTVCRPPSNARGGDANQLRCLPASGTGGRCADTSDCAVLGKKTRCTGGRCETPCSANSDCTVDGEVCRPSGSLTTTFGPHTCQPRGDGFDPAWCDRADGNADCKSGDTCDPAPKGKEKQGIGICVDP